MWLPCATTVIVGNDLAGRLPPIDCPRAVIHRLGAVAIFEAVVDLRLVSLLILPRQRSEEDSAIEMLAIADALGLKHEVGELLLGLQISWPVFHVEPALRRDGKL